MAIVTDDVKPIIKPTVVVTENKIVHKVEELTRATGLETTARDHRESVVPHVDGVPVEVMYYNAILNKDSIAAPASSLNSAVYEQYTSYNNCMVFLDGGFDPSTDAKTKKSEATGSVTIVDILTPFEGDYIRFPFDYNMVGMFLVNEVQPLSIHDGKAYKLALTLVGIDGALYSEVEKKTVNRLNYIRLNHLAGTKYILTDEELTTQLGLYNRCTELTEDYCGEFYDDDMSLFSFQLRQQYKTVDQYLTTFLTKTMLDHTTEVYFYPLPDAQVKCVFDAIIERKDGILKTGLKSVAYMHINPDPFTPSFEPTSLTPTDLIVRLKETHRKKYITEGTLVTTMDMFCGSKDNTIYPNMLKFVTYLFPYSFYMGFPSTILEEVILTYIATGRVRYSDLEMIVSALALGTTAERFYYMPFVIYLYRAQSK